MRGQTYKGNFTPINPKKYKGDSRNIVYRSSWERKFMHWCDINENVVEWNSEELVIPYLGLDNAPHRYFPDIWMKAKKRDGTTQVYVIEIKPWRETQPAVRKKGRKPETVLQEEVTYRTNMRKWQAAEEFCKKKNWTFKVITEKDAGWS
jgi:hypothetical protein